MVASKLTLPLGVPIVPEILPLSNNKSLDGRSQPSLSGVVALPYDTNNHSEKASDDTTSFETISQQLWFHGFLHMKGGWLSGGT